MLNKVQIIGRLGKDPELKYSANGLAVANLTVATDDGYVDREGNKVDRTEWHRIVTFQRTAENCSQYLGKGSLVYVEGKLTTRKWQDQQGQDRYTTEIKADRIQFLDRKSDRANQDSSFSADAYDNQRSYQKPQNNQSENFQDYGSPFPSEASEMDDAPF